MLGLVRDLAHSGALTIVIITHKLKEVAAFVDEVTVLRRGRLAGTGPVKDLGPADLTAMMIGEPHAPANPERLGDPSHETRLAVRRSAHRRGWRPQGSVDRQSDRPCARDRRHRRRVGQRPEGPGRGSRWPAAAGIAARSSWTAKPTTPAASSRRRTMCACCRKSRCATAACRR